MRDKHKVTKGDYMNLFVEYPKYTTCQKAKSPILTTPSGVCLGFKPEIWATLV